MDLKGKRINWMGNIYQKFEAVCQEVDDIVGQDAVQYLENRVQNVGDSMKKFYSGVVHELLPFPTLINSKNHEDHSVALKNNIGSSVKSVGGVKDNNKKRDEENPVNYFIESLQDSNSIDLANDQKSGASIKHDLVNQVSDENSSDSPEVEDSCTTQEEVDDDLRETSGVRKENLHASIEEIAIESTPKPINLISVKEKEPHEFLMHSESYSDSSDSACGDLIRTKDDIHANVEQSVEENNMNSSTSQVLNFTSLSEKESIQVSLFSASSDVDEEDIDDGSVVHVRCESPHVAGLIMESQDGLVSSGCCQSMESNNESLVNSIEFSLEDIQLNDDVKLEESCVFVDDSELYAVSGRAQKLRSYKKRIQDAFTSKKRLAKEYEQLAIWYGDTDMEPSQGSSQTLLPFSSRTYADSKKLQVQQASETEWELL